MTYGVRFDPWIAIGPVVIKKGGIAIDPRLFHWVWMGVVAYRKLELALGAKSED